MEVINAISKVRFASARPQRVSLARDDACVIEMLCMEPGQQARVSSGAWTYYVVTGSARITAEGLASDLPPGQAASTRPGETHTVANAGEARLVCLAVGRPG
jgi:quercetin dioxygenase-like cupin family protein